MTICGVRSEFGGGVRNGGGGRPETDDERREGRTAKVRWCAVSDEAGGWVIVVTDTLNKRSVSSLLSSNAASFRWSVRCLFLSPACELVDATAAAP